MLGVNGALETNVFLSSINAGVNIIRVNVDARWEWALTIRKLTVQRFAIFTGRLRSCGTVMFSVARVGCYSYSLEVPCDHYP